MTKERDLEFWLIALTCAIQVAYFLIDVVFRLGIARKKTIVPSHLPQPGRKRRLEIFRRQEQKIIDDRHFLLFGFGKCWRVILIESERDLQCPSPQFGFTNSFSNTNSLGECHASGSTLVCVSASEPVAFCGSFGVGSSGNGISFNASPFRKKILVE